MRFCIAPVEGYGVVEVQNVASAIAWVIIDLTPNYRACGGVSALPTHRAVEARFCFSPCGKRWTRAARPGEGSARQRLSARPLMPPMTKSRRSRSVLSRSRGGAAVTAELPREEERPVAARWRRGKRREAPLIRSRFARPPSPASGRRERAPLPLAGEGRVRVSRSADTPAGSGTLRRSGRATSLRTVLSPRRSGPCRRRSRRARRAPWPSRRRRSP
jgi:hypothetical protein